MRQLHDPARRPVQSRQVGNHNGTPPGPTLATRRGTDLSSGHDTMMPPTDAGTGIVSPLLRHRRALLPIPRRTVKIQQRVGPRRHGLGYAAPVAIAEIILASGRDVDLIRLEVSAGGTWLEGYPSAR
jgi:hypothetical protein